MINSSNLVAIFAAIAFALPANAKSYSFEPASPALEEAVKTVLSANGAPASEPRAKQISPADSRSQSRRPLSGVLIMGGPEVLPM